MIMKSTEIVCPTPINKNKAAAIRTIFELQRVFRDPNISGGSVDEIDHDFAMAIAAVMGRSVGVFSKEEPKNTLLDACMSIPGLTTRSELNFLFQAGRQTWDQIVELGTFNGRSTLALCGVAGDDSVVSVDNFEMQHHGENSMEITQQYLERFGAKPRLVSGSTFQLPLATVKGKIGLLLIDSHHHPDTVQKELTHYELLFMDGTVVMAHDIGREEYPGYTEAFREWFKGKDGWKLVGRVESLEAFQKGRTNESKDPDD